MPSRSLGAAVLVALTLAAAACGGDDPAAGSDPTVMAAGDEHMHDTVALDDAVTIPTVDVSVTPDPVKGWNVHAAVTGLTWAPTRAGLDDVAGEGHAHLYVDGEKLTRLYGEWYHIESLPPGSHEIEVGLNANGHAAFTVGGEPIADSVTIEVPEPAQGDDAGHPHTMDAAAPGPMTVDLRVEADPMKGWNVFVDTTGFTWAPQDAGADPVPGEGHAHLYVDGVKVARVYGPAFYVGDLEPGTHEVTVTLNANDHADYAVDGAKVTASVTVEVAGEAAQPDVTLEATVRDGEVSGGGRVEVAVGDRVAIVVDADVPDRLHVHGYDVYGDVAAGSPARVVFVAGAPGVFEVELEDGGIPVFELEVR